MAGTQTQTEAAPQYCCNFLLTSGPVDVFQSMNSIDTRNLTNGATCYVRPPTDAWYRYDQFDNGPGLFPTRIKPTSNVGTWKLLTGGTPGGAKCPTIYSVNASGTGDYPTIADALTAANAAAGPGNQITVSVCPGQYSIPATLDISNPYVDLVADSELSAFLVADPGVTPLLRVSAVAPMIGIDAVRIRGLVFIRVDAGTLLELDDQVTTIVGQCVFLAAGPTALCVDLLLGSMQEQEFQSCFIIGADPTAQGVRSATRVLIADCQVSGAPALALTSAEAELSRVQLDGNGPVTVMVTGPNAQLSHTLGRVGLSGPGTAIQIVGGGVNLRLSEVQVRGDVGILTPQAGAENGQVTLEHVEAGGGSSLPNGVLLRAGSNYFCRLLDCVSDDVNVPFEQHDTSQVDVEWGNVNVSLAVVDDPSRVRWVTSEQNENRASIDIYRPATPYSAARFRIPYNPIGPFDPNGVPGNFIWDEAQWNVHVQAAWRRLIFAPFDIYLNGAMLTAAVLPPITYPPTGIACYVQSVRAYFVYQDGPPAALPIDGITVLATSNGGTSRWVRQTEPNLFWQQQSVWFVDPAAGDDENDGLTSVSALKTIEEWYRRTGGGFYFSTSLVLLGTGGWTGPASALRYPVQALGQNPGTFTVIGQDQTATASGADTVSATDAVVATNQPPTFDAGVSLAGHELEYVVVDPGGMSPTYAPILFVDPTMGSTTVVVGPWVDQNGAPTVAPTTGMNIPFEVRPAMGGFTSNGMTAQGETNLVLRGLNVPQITSSRAEFQRCRLSDPAFFRADTTQILNGCWADQFNFSLGDHRLGACGARSLSGVRTTLLVDYLISVGNVLISSGTTMEFSALGIWQTGGGVVSGLGITKDSTAIDIGFLFGGAAVFGLSQHQYGVDAGGGVGNGSGVLTVVGPTPTITGALGDLRMDSAGPNYIPPLVAGAVVPAVAACTTWVQWAAAPFTGRLTGYNSGSAITV